MNSTFFRLGAVCALAHDRAPSSGRVGTQKGETERYRRFSPLEYLPANLNNRRCPFRGPKTSIFLLV